MIVLCCDPLPIIQIMIDIITPTEAFTTMNCLRVLAEIIENDEKVRVGDSVVDHKSIISQFCFGPVLLLHCKEQVVVERVSENDFIVSLRSDDRNG